MFISEPSIRLESPSVAGVRVPAGLRPLVAVFAIALMLFVAMLTVTPCVTRACSAPRAGTPIHLAR
jgi:hypothetical protein